jgi:hypothetical protein
MGYHSAWSRSAMSTRRERNDFYTAAGKAVSPGAAAQNALAGVTPEMDAADVLKRIA